jgi:rare lipoprotein A
MRLHNVDKYFVVLLTAVGLACAVGGLPPAVSAGEMTASPDAPHLDRTGSKRVGTASFYAKKFAGRKMADGTPMRPQGNNAASKTLPLGTTAKVTNLNTGKSAVVTIRDRGPYVKGRIVDLSPSTARQIGIGPKEGVARVEVAPIEVPLADGRVKHGAAYAYVSRNQRASDGWDN